MFSILYPSLILTLLLCGALAGVSAVLFGFGGGFVIVPLLYHLLTATQPADAPAAAAAMHIAIATSTAVMITNAGVATLRQHRLGVIRWDHVRPLALPIAVGALIGAALANIAEGPLLRWAFVLYLSLTIADCLLRRGFLAPQAVRSPRPPGRGVSTLAGALIGTVAAFLGVGGSVMTVPLLRRRGLPMGQAAAMANPLTLPVAVAGTLAYLALARQVTTPLGPAYIGYVNLPAFAALALGSVAGVRLAAPLAGRLPDRLHARVYIALLMIVAASLALK